jgi:hypothetical protein
MTCSVDWAINADLVANDAHLPTRRRGNPGQDPAPDPFSPESEARNTERVLGDRRHGLTEPN